MNFKQRIKDLAKKLYTTDSICVYILLSLFMTFVIECLSRNSFIDGFVFPFVALAPFLISSIIIFITYMLATLMPKKIFSVSLVTVLWLTLGIINLVLMSFRTTPLSPIDFYIFLNVISIINVYLSIPEIILYVALVVLAITGLVFVCIKTPKFKIKWKRALIAIACAILALLLVCLIGTYTKTISKKISPLYQAYKDYGFVYCFTLSLIDQGIDEPEDYSKDTIDNIVSLTGKSPSAPKKTPNVIFVQLESFFDVNYIKDIEFSENPVPNFTALKNKYEHGTLIVPTIGAGTVNTEFEILSGMNIAYFGAGEYPYKSILAKTTCESIAYNLGELGYTSTAIHNHEGSFYSRNEVYENLGFDRFVSIEYMDNEERNANGWAKDSILTKHITDSLTTTDGKDFVFAVSVQAHGKYPTSRIDDSQDITISGIENNQLKNQYEYFVNQLSETDEFIGELVDEVMSYSEDTILVIYGDHLPSLSISEEDLKEGSLFTTEYVIISNYEREINKESNELTSYELAPYVLKDLGITNGFVNRLHQNKESKDSFEEMLEALMYDMLYGKRYVFDKNEEYYPSKKIQMGIDPVEITSYELKNGMLFVYGNNFTRYSNVYINGKSNFSGNTSFVDEHTLLVKISSSTEINYITVAQISDTDILLSVSEKFEVGE